MTIQHAAPQRRTYGPHRTRAVSICALLLVAACSGERGADERPVVAVSVLPLAYFVDRIAGDSVRVEVLLPPGASPVTYEPSMRQLTAIADASLYVEVGHPHFPFEATWLDAILDAAGTPSIVSASDGDVDEHTDPHVWLSPARALRLSARIEAALAREFPAESARSAATRLALDRDIEAAERELRDSLAPHRGGHFYVFHPAWGEIAREYGIIQVAIERDGKAPDAHDLLELVERIRDDHVEVIFAQPHFSRASVDVLASETGARVELLDPLAYDWPYNVRDVARKLPRGIVP